MFITNINLWGTLIKGNPQFNKAKLELTRKFIDKYVSYSVQEIEISFKDTKKYLNNIIESTGWMPEQKVMFKFLFFNICNERQIPNIEEYINDYQELALLHKPLIYSDETIEYLEKLSIITDLHLSSNTLLIESNTIIKILESYDMLKYFKQLNFSDQVGVSKPNRRMYGNANFHIGDNIITDFEEPFKFKIRSYLINNKDWTKGQTIKNAYEFIDGKIKT
jgi:FMN phosphatase YigB (HAD superfamily)